MDMHTIWKSVAACCVPLALRNTDDNDAHQCAPFCAVQAWAPIGAQKVAEVSRHRQALAEGCWHERTRVELPPAKVDRTPEPTPQIDPLRYCVMTTVRFWRGRLAVDGDGDGRHWVRGDWQADCAAADQTRACCAIRRW